ncbi:hypothetical protein JARBOU2352_26280 (plasmid) [Enterococcus faecium]|nr:hypothetical protein EfmAA818_28800 [Enterococcus faecium]BDP96127.1 hypothetical protein EfmGK941_31320 [Enterococcus faecium]
MNVFIHNITIPLIFCIFRNKKHCDFSQRFSKYYNSNSFPKSRERFFPRRN